MRWPWRRRQEPQWVVVIVSETTANIAPVRFLTFAEEHEAAAWAERGNQQRLNYNGTHYEYRPIAQLDWPAQEEQ